MKLWNHNFIVLTVGSFISQLGSAVAAIGLGFLIYKKTGSPMTLVIFTIMNLLPRIVANIIIGPYIDRHSRKKIIIKLDYFYVIVFSFISFILFKNYFNVLVFTLFSSLLGVLDTVYKAAFNSLFPEVVPEGDHTEAYSVYSLIWPLTTALMAPVAAFMIDNFNNGIAILLLFNAVTFFITATLELTIKVKEELNNDSINRYQYIHDIKKGIQYLKIEKGILGIALLFGLFSFVSGAHELLRMPYFVNHDNFSLTHFSFIVSAISLGRIIGGVANYFIKFPINKKFMIVIFIYFIVESLAATLLFLNYYVMIVSAFILGLLSITSMTIRTSTTQSIVEYSATNPASKTPKIVPTFQNSC